MDETVLKNIKRQNISAGEAIDVARKGNEVGSNTYSEIILCLPGDTKDAHFKTIKQMVDAGLNFARLFTLMMLPGTELSSESTRRQYEMATKYRVLPRCFGSYDFGGTTLHSLETEEVCVANNTMPFDDYLDCRVMDLFVEVFYNDGIFEELLGLMKLFGISAFDWVSYLYHNQDRMPEEIRRLVNEFRGETDNELWPSARELDAHARNEDTIRRYVSGELGSNLIFKYKALIVLRHGGAISTLAFDLTRQMLESTGVLDAEPWLDSYLDDLAVFSSARKSSTLDTTIVQTHSFGYDLKAIEADQFRGHPKEHATPDATVLTFRHTSEQADYIRRYLDVYGDSVIGLSRILANIFVKRMYRSIEYV
ncbi:MAG: hypothetical protein QGF59_07200, partial [Pirellulaceae bacterium]|nr:hypothetical protein [Pirellulaceae bacterium]